MRRSRCVSNFACALLVAVNTLAAAQSTLSTGEELLLEIEVNGLRVADTALMLRAPDGRFQASADNLKAWRLRVPQTPSVTRDAVNWFALESLPGVSTRFDAARLRLSIDAPPSAFEASSTTGPQPPRQRPSEPHPGGFANYQLVATRAGGESSYAAQLEGGVFGRQGVLVAGALVQHNDFERGVVRLDTTYTRDFPGRLESLRVGDTVTFGGAWGRPLRIGGVQWSTNFALQPGFIAFPTFTARGETALPSTVDVFVNNALVAQQPVPPGPFAITNIPTVSGTGDVQLVVRDLTGRQVVISQPFYGASALLQAGLSEHSIEVGVERENFGAESFDYGGVVASATWRRGMSDRLTAEVHGEATRELVALGANVDYLLPGLGIASATVAGSEAKSSATGVLAGLGFSHEARDLGFTFRSRWTSEDWRQAGVGPFSPVPKVEIALSVGASLGRFGSLNAAYVGQRFRERPASEFATIGWTVPLVRGSALGLTALRNFTDRSTLYSMTLTVPFGAYETASVGHFITRGGAADHDYTQVNVQRSLPVGEGWGYRIHARSESDVQAGVALQTQYGTYAAEATRFESINGLRLSASGGVGVLGGHAFASREITESFGVVTVDDYADVGILVDNQPAARTDARGYAVIPRLRAYDINRIGVVQGDLPLDASIDRLSVEAVPYFRSGVLVEFPIRRSHGATLRIVLDDGTPVPAGATLTRSDAVERFPVGNDGQTYVTGLARKNTLVARWNDSRCQFELPFPASRDPLPDLGTFVCKRSAP